ncbi:MAG: hypothetical protein ACKOTZ_11300, partial [Chloroflexota bacterium]
YMLSCLDDTSGSRTRGTANIWTSYKAEAASSSPAGICGGATPAPTATPSRQRPDARSALSVTSGWAGG